MHGLSSWQTWPQNPTWTCGPAFLAPCLICTASTDSISASVTRLECCQCSHAVMLSMQSHIGSAPVSACCRSSAPFEPEPPAHAEVRSPSLWQSVLRGKEKIVEPLGEMTARRRARRTAMQRCNFERFDERADSRGILVWSSYTLHGLAWNSVRSCGRESEYTMQRLVQNWPYVAQIGSKMAQKGSKMSKVTKTNGSNDHVHLHKSA